MSRKVSKGKNQNVGLFLQGNESRMAITELPFTEQNQHSVSVISNHQTQPDTLKAGRVTFSICRRILVKLS